MRANDDDDRARVKPFLLHELFQHFIQPYLRLFYVTRYRLPPLLSFFSINYPEFITIKIPEFIRIHAVQPMNNNSQTISTADEERIRAVPKEIHGLETEELFIRMINSLLQIEVFLRLENTNCAFLSVRQSLLQK